MVKLQGPSISLGAAGAIGGSLVFASNKGRAYAKKLTKPAQPRSPDQLGQRAATGFLTKQWSVIQAVFAPYWLPAATSFDLPPYQAYLKYNIRRWSIFTMPTAAYPPNPAMPVGVGLTISATARRRTILVTLSLATANANWGAVLCTDTTPGFPPWLATAITCMPIPSVPQARFIHGPLDPGTYYYRAFHFAVGGNMGTASPEASATIT